MSTGRQARIDYPKPKRTIGKFDSIGSATDQAENAALMRLNLADIRMRGTAALLASDLLFLEDVEMKLGQKGNPMFGWRQVENMTRIHTEVCNVAKQKSRGTGNR